MTARNHHQSQIRKFYANLRWVTVYENRFAQMNIWLQMTIPTLSVK
jgi:hypothetical protein